MQNFEKKLQILAKFGINSTPNPLLRGSGGCEGGGGDGDRVDC
jgi:hypothetical protein